MNTVGPDKDQSAAEITRAKRGIFSFRMITSLENPAFRLYYLGTLGQMASMVVGQVTGPLLIYRITGSAALLGTMSLLSAVPMIFISFFGGVIADRIPKKQIMLIGYLCFALVSLAVGLALHTGYLSREHEGSFWVLLASSFVQGSLMGIMMPSLQAMVPELVKKEQLMNATALSMMGMNTMALIVPVLTGIVIDKFDFQAVYYGTTGLYLAGAAFLLFVPLIRGASPRGGRVLVEIRDGFTYIRRNSLVWLVLAFSTVVVALSMPFQQLLPIFTENILKVSATWLGTLMTVSGAGALAGSLALTALPNRKRGLMLAAAGLASGLTLTGFAFSTKLGLSLTIMVFMGLAMSFRGTISAALLQTYTEAGYMGRVMSLFNIQFGLAALCAFVAGLVVEVLGVQWVVGGMAMALGLISILVLVFNPRIKRLE